MTVQQPTANTLSTAPPADKYRLKDRPREESPVNEIRVTNTGGDRSPLFACVDCL